MALSSYCTLSGMNAAAFWWDGKRYLFSLFVVCWVEQYTPSSVILYESSQNSTAVVIASRYTNLHVHQPTVSSAVVSSQSHNPHSKTSD